jgi:dinuclear metal center YbgI/SA1388 family protein
MVTVGKMLQWIDEIAPFELAEEWDNVGLLAGHPDWPVERALVALDLTKGALDEAVEKRAQLIVTHHPILFQARRNLREDDGEGALLAALVRARIALIAAHTNYDNAEGGLNDALAEALELDGAQPLPHGLRAGGFEGGAQALAARAQARLGCVPRLYRAAGVGAIRRVAVCGGAGGAFWPEALKAGCDAYITGEVRHHEALAATAAGLTVVEAGHYHTERVMIKALQRGLQMRINTVQYNVHVLESAFEPFDGMCGMGGNTCS